MKLNNQTFSIILICFALVGKCMCHDKPTTPSSTSPTPSSSPPTTTPSSSAPTSSSTSPTPSSSPPTTTPSSSAPTSSSTSPTPSSSPSTPTPSSAPSPNDGSKTKTSPPPETNQFPDSPFMDPPSDAPSPTPDGAEGGSYGYSSSFNAYVSDYLKKTFSSNSKTKYNQDLVKICGHTRNPDVCLATISPLLKQKFDAIHVLQAAIKVCIQHLKMTIAGIEKHVAVSSEIASSLNDCKGDYAKALVNLEKAMDAIQAKKFGTVTIMLSGALADVTTAESKIQDLRSSKLKVEYYGFVSITASNCLSIASLIPN